MFGLTQHIKSSAFTGAIVYALQRKGKSSYAMQALYELYGNWDDVFSHMFFKIEDMTDFLFDHIDDTEPMPAILWDDAGVHASKFLYFQDVDQADLLKKLFDVIGIVTKSIILTTPVPDELLKSLRSYEFLKIKITDAPGSKTNRYANVYDNRLLPSGAHRNPFTWREDFDVMLPDEVYKKYSPIRRSYYKESITNLRDFIKTKKLQANLEMNDLKERAENIQTLYV